MSKQLILTADRFSLRWMDTAKPLMTPLRLKNPPTPSPTRQGRKKHPTSSCEVTKQLRKTSVVNEKWIMTNGFCEFVLIANSDVAKTNEEMNVVKQILEDVNNSLDEAVSEGNMITIKIARKIITVANKKYQFFRPFGRTGKGHEWKNKTKKIALEKLWENQIKKKSYKYNLFFR